MKFNNQYFSISISSLLLLLLLGSSCRPTKKLQVAISKNDTASMIITNQSAIDSMLVIQKAVKEIKDKHIDFNTFSAKIKVEYQDSKGKQPNITAYVRMIKDSLIWVSGYATVFNIEAFRMLITKDSVIVQDKINKEVQYRSIDYLNEITQIPFDFSTLQDLMIGNPIFFSDSVVSYKESDGKVLLATLGINFKNLLTVNMQNRMLIHSKLDDVNMARNRTADITYDEFETNNSIVFSTYRELTLSEKNKLDIQLKFKQYDFNTPLQVPFTIPKNYKIK